MSTGGADPSSTGGAADPSSTGGAAVVVDARGMLCPRPVLLLARAAREHPGALIEVLADDPAAETDIPAWCGLRNAQLVSARSAGPHSVFLIRSAGSQSGRQG